MFRVTIVQHRAPIKVRRFNDETEAVAFRRAAVAGGAIEAAVWRGSIKLEG